MYEADDVQSDLNNLIYHNPMLYNYKLEGEMLQNSKTNYFIVSKANSLEIPKISKTHTR